jgi:hypothetical protein
MKKKLTTILKFSVLTLCILSWNPSFSQSFKDCYNVAENMRNCVQINDNKDTTSYIQGQTITTPVTPTQIQTETNSGTSYSIGGSTVNSSGYVVNDKFVTNETISNSNFPQNYSNSPVEFCNVQGQCVGIGTIPIGTTPKNYSDSPMEFCNAQGQCVGVGAIPATITPSTQVVNQSTATSNQLQPTPTNSTPNALELAVINQSNPTLIDQTNNLGKNYSNSTVEFCSINNKCIPIEQTAIGIIPKNYSDSPMEFCNAQGQCVATQLFPKSIINKPEPVNSSGSVQTNNPTPNALELAVIKQPASPSSTTAPISQTNNPTPNQTNNLGKNYSNSPVEFCSINNKCIPIEQTSIGTIPKNYSDSPMEFCNAQGQCVATQLFPKSIINKPEPVVVFK